MLANVKGTLVLIALGSLLLASVVADARRDLYDVCADLKIKMAGIPDVHTNASVALKAGQKYLKKPVLCLSKHGARYKLSRAWAAVVRGEPCGLQSAEHVALINECSPDSRTALATLFFAVRDYTARCLTPDFWDDQLRRTLRPDVKLLELRALDLEDKTNLKSFLTDQFIETYKRDNPNEPTPTLYNSDSRLCCRPDRSHRALFARLAPIFQLRPDQNARLVIKNEPALLQGSLEKYLFKPCAEYVKTLGPLISQASRASNYYAGFSERFVTSLSANFQNAIFRFKYCNHFRNLLRPVDKMDELGPL